eukprot:jgi/Botrbrau1/8422/Bobra.0237s0042.1
MRLTSEAWKRGTAQSRFSHLWRHQCKKTRNPLCGVFFWLHATLLVLFSSLIVFSRTLVCYFPPRPNVGLLVCLRDIRGLRLLYSGFEKFKCQANVGRREEGDWEEDSGPRACRH